ncbi:MAG: radical SAM protein [Theionarchaea archaeon]|nr:radical SAM protein [Theionarchaea archaeon]
MTTFLLLNPHRWYPASPPVALDYVAWELEKKGITSEVVDVAFTEQRELESLLQQTQYDGVCLTIRNLERTVFSEKLHFPLPDIRELVKLVKKYCTGPIIVGGNGFSILPERILEYLEADYGIWGAGEEALPSLIQHITDGENNLSSIPYLVYRDNGEIRKNPQSSTHDSLPAVKRGFIDYHRYFNPGHEHFYGFGNVEAKRGCPHGCVYCVEPEIKGRSVRIKSPEDVTKEVDWFLERGINYFFLADSEFNTDSDAACSLLQYWKERGYYRKMRWTAYATPSSFTEELAQLLAESGTMSIMIDFCHISQKMLNNLGKSYTQKDIEDTIHLCEKFKVPFRGSLMLGGPGETWETMEETLQFFRKIACKIFLVCGIRVFPCTPLGEKIKKAGPLMDNPNLYGKVIDNDDLFEPIYYISHDLGEGIFDYLSEITGNSEQFYTVAPPFTLTREMCGNFRGVTPEYETQGRCDPQYISRLSSGKVSSPIFKESEVI